jgi:hypothetical protein
MKTFAWSWIAGFSTWIFFWPPREGRSIGLESLIGFSSAPIDITALIVTLLAFNIIPIVILINSGQMNEWIRHHRRVITIITITLVGICIIMVAISIAVERSRAQNIYLQP